MVQFPDTVLRNTNKKLSSLSTNFGRAPFEKNFRANRKNKSWKAPRRARIVGVEKDNRVVGIKKKRVSPYNNVFFAIGF